MVKQSTHNRLSLGSIPSEPTKIVLDILSEGAIIVFPRISLVVKLVVWDHGSGVRFTHPRPIFAPVV